MPAQSQQSAQTLLRLSYLASGGDNWNNLAQADESGTLTVGGVSGAFHQSIDLKNGREVIQFDVGPLQGTEATLTDYTWEVDQSGLATFHDGLEAQTNAATLSFAHRNGWFHARDEEVCFIDKRQDDGSSYDLIVVTPPRGRPMTLWLDAKDHLLKRLVQQDANHQQSISFFSDHRKIEGVLYPFSVRQSNGNESQDIVKLVKAVHFSPTIHESMFEAPLPTFKDARLLGQQDSAIVPFTIFDGRIVVDVAIDGHSALPFLLDTGGQNYLTSEAAKLLGVEGSGNLALSGAGSQQESVRVANVKEMRVGPLEIGNQRFIIGPLPDFVQDRGKEPPIAGLIGYELLRRFPTTFNYQKKLLTFYKPGSLVSAPHGAQSLRLYFEGHSPFIQVEVDGVSGYFGIDTGDRSVTTLFGRFYEAHRFPVLQPAQGRLQGGIGGLGSALLTRVNTLSFGSWILQRPLINLNFSSQGAFSSEFDAGNLGYGALRNFVFTLDYEHRRMLLEKSSDFGEPTPYNRAGMAFRRSASGEVEVQMVNANSPAAESGFEAGDIVLSINREKPEGKPLSEFESIFFWQAGTKIDVQYKRGGKELHATFQLRELLPPDGPLHRMTER